MLTCLAKCSIPPTAYRHHFNFGLEKFCLLNWKLSRWQEGLESGDGPRCGFVRCAIHATSWHAYANVNKGQNASFVSFIITHLYLFFREGSLLHQLIVTGQEYSVNSRAEAQVSTVTCGRLREKETQRWVSSISLSIHWNSSSITSFWNPGMILRKDVCYSTRDLFAVSHADSLPAEAPLKICVPCRNVRSHLFALRLPQTQ